MDYPSNPSRNRPTERPEKRVDRVVQSKVVLRKKPLGKRFAETFLGGDARGVGSYVMLDVLLPAVRDMVADTFSQGVERLLYGEARSTSRRGYRPGGGATYGHTPYNRAYRPDPRSEREPAYRRTRRTHDFDDIIIETRVEAERVLDSLFDLVLKYERASVADLYDILGITPPYTDNKWGWTDIRGADIKRVREGYLLDLPQPEPI